MRGPLRPAAAVAAACVVAACGSNSLPVRPAATASSLASLPPTTPAATPSACSPLSAVQAWPVARRAAELVVVPALDGRIAALGAALHQQVGGVLLLGTPPATLRAQVAAGNALVSVPLLVMVDQEGGAVQRLGGLVDSLPWPRDMARTMTTAAVTAAAARVGAEMKALGVGMDLAPVLDLDSGPSLDAADPDGPRSFSPDPAVATAYGLAFARGLRQGGVIPVAKHFPGLGGASGNTDFGAARSAPLATLQHAGLLPFQAFAGAGLPAVMVSHAAVPGLAGGPASLSGAAVDGLLRRQLGFRGLVLTDSLSAGAVAAAGYSVAAAAVAAVAAGDDMVLFGSTLTTADVARLQPAAVAASVSAIVGALVGAVQSGRLPASRLDEAVVHVLAAKGVDPCAA
jgi:beta-N-acetylhexosaminidase